MSEQIRISQLPPANTVSDTTVIPVVQDNITQQATLAVVRAAIGSDTGNITFDDVTMSSPEDEDLFIKAGDDLYLDALGDDVFVRASDDIRLRTGYDFETDEYAWQFRFTDGGSQIFFNGAEDEEYGRITTDNDDGTRILIVEGQDQVRLRVDDTGAECMFNSDGELVLFSSGTETGKIVPGTSTGGGLQVEAQSDFEIRVTQGTGEEEETAIWSFEPNGQIVFPDSTVQTTAFTGTGTGNSISNGDSSVSIPDADGAVVIAVSANDSAMTQHEWQFETGGDLPGIRGPGGASGFRIYSEELVQIGAQSETDDSVFVAQSGEAYVAVGNTAGTTFLTVSDAGVAVTAIGCSTPNLNVTGNITGGNLSAGTVLGNSVTLNTSANVSVAAGQMAWNSADGTMDIGLGYGNVVLQAGQETHYVARNETGTAISNGTAVYCSGVTPSGRVSIDRMTSSISPVQFLGLATQTINNGVNGIVTWFGYVRGLDTRGTANTAISVGDETWAVGDKLYVHPTAAGKLTKVEPAAPNVKICVASIITRNQSSGVLFVRPTTNLTAADLSDVQITTPAVNQFLVYAGNRWENTALDISLDTTPALGGNLAGAGFNISNVTTITATGNVSATRVQNDGNLEIRSNVAGVARTWTFDAIGDLNLPVGGNISGSGYVTAVRVITDPRPLANLTPVAGGRAFVSDGNLVAAGNFGAEIGGGGANTVPVYSDGTNWFIG